MWVFLTAEFYCTHINQSSTVLEVQTIFHSFPVTVLKCHCVLVLSGIKRETVRITSALRKHEF